MFSPLEHQDLLKEKFHGIYRGKVEDVADPKQVGRVRVRVYPVFWNEELIPVETLPWATPAEPNFSGAITGNQNIGVRAVPDLDSWVWCFFEAGDVYQPVYFASAPAMQGGLPDGPTLTRLPDESVADRTARLSLLVAVASTLSLWNEPPPAWAAIYPSNKVLKTKAGHTEEWDDTPGQERYSRYHPSGTSEEDRPDGDKTRHTAKDEYHVVEGSQREHVKVNDYRTVVGNSEENIGLFEFKRVGGGIIWEIGGTLTINVAGMIRIQSTLGNIAIVALNDQQDGLGNVVVHAGKKLFTQGGETVDENLPVDPNAVVPPLTIP